MADPLAEQTYQQPSRKIVADPLAEQTYYQPSRRIVVVLLLVVLEEKARNKELN